MRSIIQNLVSGLFVLGIAFFIFRIMTKEKEPRKYFETEVISSVQVQTVENQNMPLQVEASGQLMAKNKLAIFAEVQGVFENTGKEFKPGVAYASGQTLVKINSEEFNAALKAKKSSLYNAIAAMMPDLKLDFPSSFSNWQLYLNSFDVKQKLAALPNPVSDKEKFFVANKNISVQYFDIKNLEEKQRKYSIKAPYSGVLTKADVTTGTLVRAGQKLGEFINPNVYELEISLSETLSDFLKIGNKVTVKNINETKTWTGTVIRKNAVLEQASQTKKVFIKLQDKNLSDGMYLKAFIQGKKAKNVIEIDRSLIVDETKVYTVVNDSLLGTKSIDVLHFNENTAIVSGLKNGDKILSKLIPGAYEGMKVNVIENN